MINQQVSKNFCLTVLEYIYIIDWGYPMAISGRGVKADGRSKGR
ncbi:hypothetical protein [Clostridium sp. 'deep sea']|nr:hypothetical protein [Clostridium sp. 'deep sea']